jgi:Ribbon-helix-helix domain
MTRRPSSRKRLVNRAGIPFQVYFTPDQMSQMRSFSKERSLPLAAIVRTAVEQLLRKWRDDELNLPLGFDR